MSAPVGHLTVEWTFHLGGIFPRRQESVVFSDFANRLLEFNINNLEIGSQITQFKIETHLQNLEFETVTVKRQGEIIRTETKQAQYFVEKLLDNNSLKMVAIPEGTSMMGSLEGKGNDREKPQHEVAVQPFFLGMIKPLKP